MKNATTCITHIARIRECGSMWAFAAGWRHLWTITAGASNCFNSLLFSFPGTPIIYYGDEIGMGDNIYLGDRNGVRTPMQWSIGPQRGILAGELPPNSIAR